MGSPRYAGAARFLEIAPPGIPFRSLVNVDHLVDVSFTNKIEEVEELIEGSEPIPAVIKDDVVIVPEQPGKMRTIHKVTGVVVSATIGGQERAFTFTDPKIGIAFYYHIQEGIRILGIPLNAVKAKIEPPPPPPSPIVGTDGESLSDDDELGLDDDDATPGIDGLEVTSDENESEDNADTGTE